MFYLIYKITNLINNRIYIGCHKTRDPDDKYMGSSKSLANDIKIYGLTNFKKEILHYLTSEAEMLIKEREIVNEDFVKLDSTYNKILGGSGSFTDINLKKLNIYGKNGQLGYGGENLIPSKGYKKCHTPEVAKKRGKKLSSNIKHGLVIPGFKDKTHSNETKKVIGNKSKIHQSGSGNSQYGTKWIFSETEKYSKKIKNTDSIPNGWSLGRKLKF